VVVGVFAVEVDVDGLVMVVVVVRRRWFGLCAVTWTRRRVWMMNRWMVSAALYRSHARQ